VETRQAPLQETVAMELMQRQLGCHRYQQAWVPLGRQQLQLDVSRLVVVVEPQLMVPVV
jgi:hypothetical protein